MHDSVSNTIFKEAYQFLVDKAGEGFVKEMLIDPLPEHIQSMTDVYRYLIYAILDDKRMMEAIDSLESLSEPLFEFDPIMTSSEYGDCWVMLFKRIKARIKARDKAKQDGAGERIEMFCRSAISGAGFLSQLGFMASFRDFVGAFTCNEMSLAVLPLLLQREIFGMRFPSACGFLRNCGFKKYISPDPKVKALLQDLDVTESRDNYETLKAIIKMSLDIDQPVFSIYRLLWMIVSDVTDDDMPKGELRNQFVNRVSPVLNSLNN